MDIRQAVDILHLLKDAIDPSTGEVLPQDHFLRGAEVQDALQTAIEKVEAGMAPEGREKSKLNAGRPWTQSELDDLRSLYEGGVSVADIARMTQRRERGVRLQLNLMAGGGARRDDRVAVPDVIEARSLAEMAPATPARGPVNSQHPWTAENDANLVKWFGEGNTPAQLAGAFGRSVYAIERRLQKLGLLDAAKENTQVQPLSADFAGTVIRSRRWTSEEDAYLRRAWAEGTAIGDMCARLDRRDRLVRCRLIFLGVCDHSVLGSAPMPPELAHQGLPWYPEEIELLTRLYRERRTTAEMARLLKRSEPVVRNRLELLGLSEYEQI